MWVTLWRDKKIHIPFNFPNWLWEMCNIINCNKIFIEYLPPEYSKLLPQIVLAYTGPRGYSWDTLWYRLISESYRDTAAIFAIDIMCLKTLSTFVYLCVCLFFLLLWHLIYILIFTYHYLVLYCSKSGICKSIENRYQYLRSVPNSALYIGPFTHLLIYISWRLSMAKQNVKNGFHGL